MLNNTRYIIIGILFGMVGEYIYKTNCVNIYPLLLLICLGIIIVVDLTNNK